MHETNSHFFGHVEGDIPHPFFPAAILGLSTYNIPESF